jgi:GT2 family glycosyltransferase
MLHPQPEKRSFCPEQVPEVMMLNPLDHPVCLASPKRLTLLTAWQEHIPFAMFLIDILRPAVVVELGAQGGDSYCAFCQAVKELNLDARCYAVDTWQGDQHTGAYDSQILDDLRAHHDPLYGSFSRLIQSTFDEALDHFADGTIDLLHIDGYHTYEAVRHDFESWLPKMSRKGVVLLHDTNVHERGFGVSRLWSEIKQGRPHFEFLHGHGLGVLAVGEVRSKELQSLFEATDQESARIREFFFQMGRRLTLRLELESQRLAAAEASRIEGETSRAEADALRAEMADCEKSLRERFKLELEEKGKYIESLSSEVERKEKLLGDKDRLIESKDRLIESKDHLIESKDHLIEEREAEIRKIKGSPGWKLLSRYGRIKHKLFLPLFRGLRNPSKILARREYRPSLEPIKGLRLIDDSGKWESTCDDPQFDVSGEWPKGRAEVLIDIETDDPVRGHARLYVDRGAGYSEWGSYDLGAAGGEHKRYVRLGPEVIALRFDPFESPGRFRIKRFTLKRALLPLRNKSRDGLKESSNGLSPLKQFVQFSMARIEGFREKHGRSPRLSDLPSAVRRTLRAWKASRFNGYHLPSETARALKDFQILPPLDPYDAWQEVNEWNHRRESVLRERLSALPEPPLLSVVMPVYNPPLEFLNRAIESVTSQVYQNWELCIADDASADSTVKDALCRWAEREPRIKILFRPHNGNISRATNSAAELARGDYLVLMDQDDEITPDALGEVALYISEHPQTDILYSDDDKIDAQGRRYDPQFKPDYSPELLLSYMYFSHLFALRRELFFEAGCLRAGLEGSQDYDLALRAVEMTDRIGHIPRALYHWRALPESTASSGRAKPESFDAGLRAVQDALDRRGIGARAYQPEWAAKAGCGIFLHEFPDDGPRVAIVIPTRNNVDVLKACVQSLEKTTYKNFEVIIIDNESDDAKTLEYLRTIRHRVLRIPNPGSGFSFAAINNRAVEQVETEYILFLNDDTEVVAPRWLSQMAGYAGIKGVGAVGARLLFPDGRIQHAGIVHGYYNCMAGPAFKLLPSSEAGYLSYTAVARNYSAVTAACMLTPRDLFLKMGGFDEQNFSVAYNDADYCYRLRAAGYRIVYCPTAELIHHEGYSRGFADNVAEPDAFRKKYSDTIDPFYNPNLSLEDERFAIAARTIAPDTARPIRALMCAFNLNREGAPYSQFEMTARLKDQGVIEPVVYCPNDGPLREAYQKRGIRVEIFEHPLAGVHELAAYDRAIENFAQRIADWNIEVVYGNTLQTFYAIDAAKRLDLPSIWNPRESEPWQTYFDFLSREIAARALRCFGYAYKVVFVADATREGCAPLNTHHNFITIHNGLDKERFAASLETRPRERARKELGAAEDEIAFLTLGTVCERKGQIDLVEAVKRMGGRFTNRLRCFIVGDRPNEYSEKLKSALHSLPISKQSRVEIVPETPDAALYYSAADVFVCTSRVESFPRVILEAMAAGLPIITTPVYGIREQVQENVNALFFQPGDADALADKMTRLIADPSLRQNLARNSRLVLDMLTDFEAMTKAYGKVFREAWLSGRSR